MLAALIIVFREVFEAGLIVGIVLAVTQNVSGRGWWITGGIAGGALGACLAAIFAGQLSTAFGGIGHELFNAAILSIAVVMLIWHNVWMARHGRELAAEMVAVGQAVAAGSKPMTALAVVVGVAVLREGVEVVLFLYGIAASGDSAAAIFVGALAGLALGAAVSGLTYFGLLNVPARHLFAVTSVMIAFLAAGLAAQATAFLQQADVVTVLDQTVWDSSGLLSDSSLAGRALHTLIGYTERPTAMELVVYLVTLAVIFVLMKVLAPPAATDAAVSKA